jgi:hypothetical protein
VVPETRQRFRANNGGAYLDLNQREQNGSAGSLRQARHPLELKGKPKGDRYLLSNAAMLCHVEQ